RELDALMADVPKDVYRVVITAELSAPVEDFIERHARRAPRFGVPLAGTAGAPPAVTAEAPLSIGYLLSAPAARPTTLRHLLDEIDPPSAVVYVRSDDCERDVRDTL